MATKLTDQQQRFIEEYCKDCNATQAAIRAGYSERSAASIGWENLRKPEISEAIASRLKELSISSEEVTKLITDIAKSNLSEFFVVKEVPQTPNIQKPLSEIIADLEEKISFEDEYIARITPTEEELKRHHSAQEARRKEVIRAQIELERNPLATRWVEGSPVLVKRAELDIVKLVEAKEGNRIKSVKHSEFGLNIEMYPADAALDKLARMHGLYEKDNEQSKPENAVTIFQLPDNGRSKG